MINNKLFRGFTFDGVNSLEYDIYITGAGVYNAPERAVEKVSVPGRNGDLTIDQGRFENIEVTYAQCGCAATTQEEFAEKVQAFRNALCSRVGYKRLTDDYNKDEYRMAMYASGLEVEAIARHRMGTFDIVFDAMPQRFLNSGEQVQTLTTGMTPKNPQTESGAIVSIEGTGADKVTSLIAQIEPVQSGSGDPSPSNVRPISGWTAVNVIVSPTTTASGGTTTTTALGRTVYGGTLDVLTGVLTVTHKMHLFDGTETLPFFSGYSGVRFQDAEMNTTQLPIIDFIASTMKGAAARGRSGTPPCIRTYSAVTGDDTHFLFVCMPDVTDAASANAWLQAHPTQVVYPITPKTYNLTAQQVELLTGDNNVWADTGDITITWGDDPYKVVNPTLFASKPLLKVTGRGTLSVGDVTMTITGTASQVLYIDCDIMEVYSMTNGQMTPQNSLVTISGNEYPTLQPGATQITLGSGITQVVITPRWWRI